MAFQYPFLKVRTKLATFSTQNNVHKFVYFQAENGSINEAHSSNGNQSWEIKTLLPPEKVKPGTPLAVASWPGSSSGDEKHCRLYYVTNELFVGELKYVSDGNSWVEGELTATKHKIAGCSSLAAIAYFDGSRIYVYLQEPSLTIRELISDSPPAWRDGRAFWINALPGTSLAFLIFGTESWPLFSGFYQDVKGDLKEVHWPGKGSWDNGTLHVDLKATVPGTTLTTTRTKRDDGKNSILVFYQNADYNIEVASWIEGKGWLTTTPTSQSAQQVQDAACLSACASETTVFLYSSLKPIWPTALAEFAFTCKQGKWEDRDSKDSIVPFR